MKESKENGIAPTLPLPVHMSTYPLMLAKKASEKGVKEAHEGGPGSGPSHSGSSSEPKVMAHFTYSGDRYKAGVRYPKSEMPKPHSYKKEADSASSNAAVLRDQTK